LKGDRRNVWFTSHGRWGKLPMLLASVLVLALGIAVSFALAAKHVESFFGERGSAEGQFENPRDPAVYNGTSGSPGTGAIYVVDDGNHRIQQFDSNKAFVRTWGGGVDDGTAVGQTCTADCQVGIAGTTDGMFDNPQGIAVNQATGDLYVRDRDNRRVQQFTSSGGFVRAWGTLGAGAGQFAASTTNSNGIAVAPGSGDVFVADPGNRRVQQFESDGDFVRAWGWGVDTGASAFEICTALTGCQTGLATPGADNGRFGANHPVHIAVDSAGTVYASDSNSGNRVMRFDSTQATAAALLLSPIGAPPLASSSTNSMEVDPSNDHLLIGRGNLGIQEFDTTTLGVVDTHMSGSGLIPTGIGIDTSDGEIMVSSISAGGHRVYVLDNVAAPDAEIAPVTDITSDSATFNGTVDPNGSPTSYHFEYSTDGLTWTNVPATFDIDAGAGDDPVAASLPVAPLEPDTDYRVRLVATKPFGAGTDTSPEALFSTPPARPTIVSSGAEPGTTTATLRGRIHPRGQQTTYRFEYGLTDGYDNAVPVPDGDAGSGDVVQSVEESISGLTPSTTYHFRLVAENGTGPSEGPDQTFTTSADSGLVERAYEKVTPEDKNGGDAPGPTNGQTGFASPSGDAVVYTASQAFGDAQSTYVYGSMYRALRRPTVWESSSILPTKEATSDLTVSPLNFVSEDLSRALVLTPNVLDTGAVGDECNLYVRDNDTGTYEFLGHDHPSTDPPCAGERFRGADASPDLAGVVFETTASLDVDVGPEPVDTPGHVKLYLWRDGLLELASVLPDGTPTEGSAAGGGSPTTDSELIDNSISDDGSVVYFTSPADVGALYRREGGETVSVSKEENPLGDPCGASGVCTGSQVFRGASTDGSRVFFTSPAQLVAEDTNSDGGGTAGVDLYMYTHSADPDNDANLTLLSRDLNLDAPDGADVQGVLGASEDGSRVYFAAENQIVPGEDSAPADIKFYVWDEHDGVRYIGGGTSNPAFFNHDFSVSGPSQTDRHRRTVSANGRAVMLLSSIPLTDDGDDDTTGDDGGGFQQAYVYDYDADKLVCVSCPAVAALGAPGSQTDPRQESNVLQNPAPTNISDDGSRAFFQTNSRLVPEDTNGKLDVYVWARGAPHLISTGRSEDRSLFIDASANGDHVFIATREQLVPWDEDDLRDIYAARVGGGLPDPRPATGTPCEGDECQGTPAGDPALMDPFSDVFGGFGNLEPGERPSFVIRRLSKAQLAKLARGGRVMLPVKVNRAGRLSLTARAKMGKRNRVVDRSSKRATKAGTVGVPLQLSKASRRQLARKRKLRVLVSVRFAGVREPRGMTLRLQRTGGGS